MAPRIDPNAVCRRRHPEWQESAIRWRWLMDSLEGGDRYRNAIYGIDAEGMPLRNLVRHKHEYPDPYQQSRGGAHGGSYGGPGSPVLGGAGYSGDSATLFAPGVGADQAQYATIDDYEYRRARTPVPSFVREAVETHLSEIFSKEVRREGPDGLMGWWADVDGAGTVVDDWIQQDVAPLLLVLGQLDVCLDHPASNGSPVGTRADAIRLGLGRCVASTILPENMLWWRLDPARRYAECLVLEYAEDTGRPRLRYWDAEGWVLCSCPRDWHPSRVRPHDTHDALDSGEYRYGRPPIVRVFDRRKARTRNIGQSRYESIAEKQRESYNRASELILSDTIQAHPSVQAPEDFCDADATLPIGPGFLLPMKKLMGPNGVSGYQPFAVLDFPKDGAASLRTNIHDLRDEIDRDARLTKPAGVSGTGRSTVSQSGVSKALDHRSGNVLLAQMSAALGKMEMQFAELALVVLSDGPPRPAEMQSVSVVYPTSFNLFDIGELSTGIADFQQILASAGDVPETEILLLTRLRNELLVGEDDETYDVSDREIRVAVEAKAQARAQGREMSAIDLAAIEALPPEGTQDVEPPGAVLPGGGAAGGGADEPQYRPPGG